MLRVADIWERAIHTPAVAVDISGDAPGEVIIIRAGSSYDGKQGMNLATGVSSRSAGSRALCLHLVTIPPGTRGVPHVHDGHESAIYTVSGETEVWHGEGLRHRTVVKAGDFMYVPPGIPHLPVNRSDVMTVAAVARTDPRSRRAWSPSACLRTCPTWTPSPSPASKGHPESSSAETAAAPAAPARRVSVTHRARPASRGAGAFALAAAQDRGTG